MGVNNLWQILEPVRQPVSLSSLKGKTLAVDLSLWVCEAQTVKKMIGVVTKPHLRLKSNIEVCLQFK
uniref:GEN1 Holliday junction 5' flap endonuclease n=1 Tax=Gallus gallus TaxID=9031 RepID=A0A8V0XFY0_CHICK